MSIRLPLTLSVATVLCLAPAVASAQDTAPRVPAGPPGEAGDHPAPNSVFFEGLGSAVLYSINYERRVIDDLGLRIGLSNISELGSRGNSGGLGISVYFPSTWLVPLTASYLGVRSGRHTFEFGGGPTLSYSKDPIDGGFGGFGSVFVGYRLHPVNGTGFQLRVGAMGLVGSFGVVPWGYLSLGAGF